MSAYPTAVSRCVSETTTTGTGTLTVGNEPSETGVYISLADAVTQGLVSDGDLVDYILLVGDLGNPTAWEEGRKATVGSSGTTVTRTPVLTYDGTSYDGTSPTALNLAAGTKYLAVAPSAGTINARWPSTAHGTITSGTETPEPSDGAFQTMTNNGAFTLAPPTEDGAFVLTITNAASAGAITTSGFDDVHGDAFDTTNGNVFECGIMNTGTRTSLTVTAATDNA